MKKIRIFLVVTLFAALTSLLSSPKPVMADTNKAIPNQAYYTTLTCCTPIGACPIAGYPIPVGGACWCPGYGGPVYGVGC